MTSGSSSTKLQGKLLSLSLSSAKSNIQDLCLVHEGDNPLLSLVRISCGTPNAAIITTIPTGSFVVLLKSITLGGSTAPQFTFHREELYVCR